MNKFLLTILIITLAGFYTYSNARFREVNDIETTVSVFVNRIKKGVEDDNVNGSISVIRIFVFEPMGKYLLVRLHICYSPSLGHFKDIFNF